jgi:glutathione synthase/RimK-type ligase-like ATP-grasp enzyme/ribosomal protein S18 acetylase RimI-like enzyme
MQNPHITIRKALKGDLDFLEKLELSSFSKEQQSKRKNLAHSLKSPSQEVWIAETKEAVAVAALILFMYKRSLRIYSIAVSKEYRGLGLGEQLLKKAQERAQEEGLDRISLEASAAKPELIQWYVDRGFATVATLSNYYDTDQDAVKMELHLNKKENLKRMQNILVINHPHKWKFPDVNATVVSVKDYISNPAYQAAGDYRVFNLCSSYKYQSYGYYVSLLASARGQRVIPSSISIRDLKIVNVLRSASYDIEEAIQIALQKVEDKHFSMNVYFGQTTKEGFKQLAMDLYKLFEVPLFQVNFIKAEQWLIKNIKVLTLSKIEEQEVSTLYQFARDYFNKKRFYKTRLTNFKYDIAVLVNPDEATPPSCPKALEKLKQAANKKGLYLEFIRKNDLDRINEFDALFIRETTNVKDHTYEFSRMAYAEGLAVIDDPWSILKCSNKIYLNELFRKNKILAPQTQVFTKNFFHREELKLLQYPVVLKQPDSSFSLGVTKVNNESEAFQALQSLFKKSDMVICQEFLYSEFDWRIGVLDNKAIYACKYYMSKGHWQIYNWKGDKEEQSGEHETLPIEAVPNKVIQTALKAARPIGDGLYGVDLKQIGDKVYVIEVNDNPNIDAGVEDEFLKDHLYELLIDSIYQRIESLKNIPKIHFAQP